MPGHTVLVLQPPHEPAWQVGDSRVGVGICLAHDHNGPTDREDSSGQVCTYVRTTPIAHECTSNRATDLGGGVCGPVLQSTQAQARRVPVL